MRTLKLHSQGVDVYFLQRLLNKAAARSGGRLRPVTEDGNFGSIQTDPAVRAFQAQARTPRLTVDGKVGEHTWPALGLTVDIDHHITLVAQTTNWSCWQAAASMVSEGCGAPLSVSTSPQHMQFYLTSGLSGRAADAQLAQELGWRPLNHSPDLPELIGLMRRTPLYVSGRLTATGGSHAVAFGGLYSDGQPDGTVIKVYNPSPVGSGLIHQLFYDHMTSPISGSPFVPFSFLVPR